MGFLSGLLNGLKKNVSSTNNGNSENYYSDGSRKYKGPLKLKNVEGEYSEYNGSGTYPSRESVNSQTIIDVPAWGYKDFINERVSFQKGLDSSLSEPAWFYFKLFFKFDTKYGLLGGIMKGTDGKYAADNTAIQYLWRNQARLMSATFNRSKALVKFVRTLSFISSKAPWFFHSVKDANMALTMNLQNLTAEKSIEIECNEDATDMRLLTLMDLYKYAAYDAINQKEIIPENLRKFDLDIIVFQSPIRYIHTSSRDLKGRSTVYKNFNAGNMTDRMSFKLFSFQGCEIDYNSLNNFLPQTFQNDKPFNSKPTFKIKYDRVYQHNQNEFAKLLVGDTGLLWDQNGLSSSVINGGKFVDNKIDKDQTWQSGYSLGNISKRTMNLDDVEISGSNVKQSYQTPDNDNTRREMMKYANDNKYYYNPASQSYKTLVDASESAISAAMMLIDGSAGFGNLYGDSSKWNSGLKSIANSTKKAYKDTFNNGIKNFLQF